MDHTSIMRNNEIYMNGINEYTHNMDIIGRMSEMHDEIHVHLCYMLLNERTLLETTRGISGTSAIL